LFRLIRTVVFFTIPSENRDKD